MILMVQTKFPISCDFFLIDFHTKMKTLLFLIRIQFMYNECVVKKSDIN